MSLVAKILSNRDNHPLNGLILEYFLVRDKAETRLTDYEMPLVDDELRPPGRFSPSSIGGCKRRGALGFIGVGGTKPKDPKTERTFWRGKWGHHEWQATLVDMQLVLGEDKIKVLSIEEKTSIVNLFIRGTLDVRALIHSDPAIIDIKTADHFNYQGVMINGVPEYYIKQITTYLKSKDITQGIMLFDDKFQDNWRTIPVDFDSEIWDGIESWCYAVIDFLKNHDLPPMDEECKPGSRMQRWCPYSDYCYKSPEEDLHALAFTDFTSPQDWWDRGEEIERTGRKSKRLKISAKSLE